MSGPFELSVAPGSPLEAAFETFFVHVGPNLVTLHLLSYSPPSSLLALCPNLKTLKLRGLSIPHPQVQHPGLETITVENTEVVDLNLWPDEPLFNLCRAFPSLLVVQVDEIVLSDHYDVAGNLRTIKQVVRQYNAVASRCEEVGLVLQGPNGRAWTQSHKWKTSIQTMCASF